MLDELRCIIVIVFYATLAFVQSGLRVVTVPKLFQRFFHAKRYPVSPNARVAVIGGGIAGTTAAWALKKSGKFSNVTLIEPREVLGGNAKTHLWDVEGVQHPVRTGLSVLAWPPAYFKHYEMLLQELKLPTVEVVPKFYVSPDGQGATFRQGEENPRWRREQQQWDRAVSTIRFINKICFEVTRRVRAVLLVVAPFFFERTVADTCTSTAPSMYEVTMLNPMNVIPARWFCRVFFGISDEFWNHVVVPIYSSSFLTARLDGLPCVILPALDDIISVGDRERLKKLNTWTGSSKDVFDRMAATIGEGNENTNVLVGVEILSCVQHESSGKWSIEYRAAEKASDAALARIEKRQDLLAANGGSMIRRNGGDVYSAAAASPTKLAPSSGLSYEEWFDYVVFACPATAVDTLTNDDRNRSNACTSCFRDSLFEAIVPNVRYENERDENFVTGYVHRNRTLAIPNETMRQEFLSKRFTNYIELHGDPKDGNLENTFALGTWVPAAVSAAAEAATSQSVAPSHKSIGKTLMKKQQSDVKKGAVATTRTSIEDGVPSMFVTYNPVGNKKSSVEPETVLHVDNSWAHPQFTMQSLGLSMALPLLQGRHHAFYCASYTTPGNGHDLSLLSGLAVVHELTGGYYPFEETATVEARKDFVLLKKLLFM